jgi:hypothetical protein
MDMVIKLRHKDVRDTAWRFTSTSVRERERKRLLGRPSCRWEEDIKTYVLKEWAGFNWLRIGYNGRLL